MTTRSSGTKNGLVIGAVGTVGLACGAAALAFMGGASPAAPLGSYVVLGYSDSGIHFTGDDFSTLCILPPYSTIRAQVIRRGNGPEILDGDVTVKYSFPGNTRASEKTNFWEHAQALFGTALAPDVGLTGHKLSGTMTPTAANDWQVTAVPLVPVTDDGRLDPYQAALITVTGPLGTASARPVVAVSTEVNCSLCHGQAGASVMEDILLRHDEFQGTDLFSQQPVLCAKCHADPFLGAPGLPDVPSLSSSMHTWHAPYTEGIGLDNACYACHPGFRTKGQRDVHAANGIQCADCHGTMATVGDPARTPWSDLPRCGNCHNVPGHQYEQPGKLYKNSMGHSGVECVACHGSPHAITATVTALDNQQAIALQGHAGTIDTCNVCHTVQPSDPFFHSVSND